MAREMYLEGVGMVKIEKIISSNYFLHRQCRECGLNTDTAATIDNTPIHVPCHEDCLEGEEVKKVIMSIWNALLPKPAMKSAS